MRSSASRSNLRWVPEYRASFDASISFSNGGGLTARGFRVDVPSPDVGEAEIAALFVASLGLLMTDAVRLDRVEIFAEPHKGTRGGPSDHSTGQPAAGVAGPLVELNHVIRAGMITYPGLPGPSIAPHLTREASRDRYAPGTEFAIDQLTLVGNTGTYLDAPYHRYPDGADLSAVPLDRTADLPATVVRVAGTGRRAIDVGALAALDVRGRAVLLHTGDDAGFGSRPTPSGRISSPGPGRRGWPPTGRRWSASTRSTSMTSTTTAARPTRCCLRPAFPSSSI